MVQTGRYPFDTDILIKGSTVSSDDIASAYGAAPGTARYQLALLQAREYVTRAFAARGEIVTVVADGNVLRILTDDQQVEYNPEQFRAGIRKASRAHTRMLGADRAQITKPDLLQAHDRALEVQGRQLAAVRREARKISVGTTPRLTPGRKSSK